MTTPVDNRSGRSGGVPTVTSCHGSGSTPPRSPSWGWRSPRRAPTSCSWATPRPTGGRSGPGQCGSAVEELLGGWRRVRLALGGSLTELGEAAVGAGSLYLDTETGVSRSLAGGPW